MAVVHTTIPFWPERDLAWNIGCTSVLNYILPLRVNMPFGRKFVVAVGFFATEGNGFRKVLKSRQEVQRAHPGADTFDMNDEGSQEQMELEPSARIQTIESISDEDPPAAFSTPIAAGSRPKCADRSNGRRVVSMADMHGDFDGLVKHMHSLGLLSRVPTKSQSTWRNIWAGGDTIFVQTGDILDRGPDGKVMYKFLWALQDQAPKDSVVLLTGNHELMVLQGDIRYVTDVDFCAYTRDNCGGKPPSRASYCDTCCTYRDSKCSSGGRGCMKGNCEFLASWDRRGEMGGEMRKRFVQGKMKLAYEINGVVFTHAGLASSIWGKIGTRGSRAIEKLNNLTATLFNSSSGKSLRSSRSVIAAGTGQNGPMWSRMCYDDWYTAGARRRSSGGKAYMDSDEVKRVQGSRCATIAKSLRDIGASRMVIGHCPQGPSSRSAGVRTSCSGQFVEADTYMSIAYAGSRRNADRNLAALEFFSQDAKKNVWVVYSGQNRCVKLPSAR